MSLRKGIDSMLEIINADRKENEPKNDAGGQHLENNKTMCDGDAEAGVIESHKIKKAVESLRSMIKEMEAMQEVISRNLSDVSQYLEEIEKKS